MNERKFMSHEPHVDKGEKSSLSYLLAYNKYLNLDKFWLKEKYFSPAPLCSSPCFSLFCLGEGEVDYRFFILDG